MRSDAFNYIRKHYNRFLLYRKLKNLQAVFSFFRLNKGKTGDYYESQENNNLLLYKKMGYTVVCGNEVFRGYGYPALWHIRNTQERGRSDGMRKLS